MPDYSRLTMDFQEGGSLEEQEDDIERMVLAKKPNVQGLKGIIETEMIYGGEGVRGWGRKTRFLQYWFFIDDFGIVRELKGKMKYDDAIGFSKLVGITVTFDRPSDLQAQLEGTENRIAVARKRFIESVAEYNKVVLRFPSMIGAKMRGKSVRPTFSGDPVNEKPPEVKF